MADETRNLQVKISSDSSQFTKAMNDMAAGTSKAETSFKALTAGIAAGNLVYNGLIGILGKAQGFFIDSGKAADQQELAIARLTAGIQNVSSAGDKSVQALLDQATALQKTTRFSDEAVISAQGIFTTFQLNQRVISALTPSLLDMSEGLAKVDGAMPDLENNAMLVAKALGGEDTNGLVTALRKAGVSFTETQKAMLNSGDFQQRLSVVTQVLSNNFKGMAEAAGNTAAGGIAKMNNQINEAQEAIGNIERQLTGGFVAAIGDLVGGNSQAIASFVAAASAVGIFGVAVLGLGKVFQVVGAQALVAALANPITYILLALAAAIGVFVYGAMQRMQDSMKNAQESAQKLGDGLGSAVPKGISSATKALKDMNDQLAKVDEQAKQANITFQQSLADMVKGHQDKVATLKDQLKQENSDFAEKLSDQEKTYKANQEQMATEHQNKVDSIQKQINKQLSMGKDADEQELRSLYAQMDKENAAYALQDVEKQKSYEEDTLKVKTAHEKKVTDLQASLDQETAILAKHTADIATIRQTDYLDDIDKLKQSHTQQMKSFEDQKAQIIKNSQETTAGIAQSYTDLSKSSALTDSGSTLGKSIGGAIGIGVKQAFTDEWQGFVDTFKSGVDGLKQWFQTGDITGKETGKNWWDAIMEQLNPNSDTNKKDAATMGGSLLHPKRATGGPVTAGKQYQVNEEGVEMFIPDTDGQILSHDRTMEFLGGRQSSSVTNQTVFSPTINVPIGMYAGMPVEKRQIALDLWRELQRAAKAQGVILPNIGVSTQ